MLLQLKERGKEQQEQGVILHVMFTNISFCEAYDKSYAYSSTFCLPFGRIDIFRLAQ